ncbi:MAG: GNAT family N-acetyltransferase [Candidatus Bipolaricaulota bacterium]|nr:GNAT family N-acetyltransferase [Candidatus Bipolaricaulota bacterium]MDW8141218.1 GNAT family protein [Candidatus Bipolaricaulota bacterium]
MRTPFLIGEKVYLRPLERDDAPLLLPWVNDPDVIANLMMYTPKNLQNELEFIERAYKSDDEIILGIALKANDKLIGSTGLHRLDWKNRHCMFGILIGDKTEWGKGYGTETTCLMARYAFETLGMHRVWLSVYEYNQRGIRAYEKAGFVREGLLRQARYHNGRFYDVLVMGLLRSEWEAQRSTP